MQKNDLLKYNNTIIRILSINKDLCCIIDCLACTMPRNISYAELESCEICDENFLYEKSEIQCPNKNELTFNDNKIIAKRFSIIAPILPYIADKKHRTSIIHEMSITHNISKQTIRKYLCIYLVYQDKRVLCNCKKEERKLSDDEKNIRWGLNKFFYSQKKNSLKTAHEMMLKEKYCDQQGNLAEHYPSFYQFRYYYRKHRKLQNYYISRNGLNDYQKNCRPLLGEGVQQYADGVGMGMLDSTVCDIYLINNDGQIVGRPILTACVDAYSSLCCGYALTWEGGTYSIQLLLKNILEDKQQWCKKFEIEIDKKQWDCNQLPGIMVTDKGSEYKSESFAQITNFGITIINLPPYRPELKGSVEKFFNLIQDLYKPLLKGKGVVQPDFMERGAHDYRKDACLTLYEFEKILLHCIVYYNSQRIINNYRYTPEMIAQKIKPYASEIWEYGKQLDNANLISISKKDAFVSLLPTTTGRFTRHGLKVNDIRYKNSLYTEKYLSGGEVTVSYDPNNVSSVWIKENNTFVKFDLIETRFKDFTLQYVEEMKISKRQIMNEEQGNALQAKIKLIQNIEDVKPVILPKIKLNDIRRNRSREQEKMRINGGDLL